MKITYQLESPVSGKLRWVTSTNAEALALYLHVDVRDLRVGVYPNDGVTILGIELDDDDLEHVTGGARPSPERDCWAAPMGGKCYPAAPIPGVNWPLSLKAQRAARYGGK